ncbi:unnamed protein product [Durusdinium trenchii]|uniref:3-oxoacyl-[acyl-carrier-protein] reductase n=1 Tax=Durusdinium trenchii TaxID=1381693 RepID=A0ABP0NIJ4_9DINO
MSTLELGRVHMTVKVKDDMVEYKPKEGVMSATYPVFEFDKDEWNRMVGTAEDGMVIEYEEISSSTTTTKGGEGAVPEGGFKHPHTKVYCLGQGAFLAPDCQSQRIIKSQSTRQQTLVRSARSTRPDQYGRTALKAGAETGFDLTGKVALVTGASRGIGAAIAESLAKAGATVVGTATSDSGAEAISARMGDQWGQGMKLDVTDSKNVEEVVKAVTEKYGAPDILVNNAGITKDTLMMRMKEDQWLDVINTNLNSVFRMTKAATKGMTKKRWGRVISISSVVGSMGNVGQSNYAAAKAGMDGWTRAMAREIGSRGITVNSVAPGFIDTDMTADLPDDWKDRKVQ